MDQPEHAQLFTADGNTMLFEGASLRGSLRGLLFEATVEQRFRNHEKTAVEAIYSFPLPAGAVLLGVDVQIDQRRLTGQVVERTEASARYEGAVSEGNSAVLLEHNNDGTCTLNLGNLGPGEQCTIALRYGQTLRFEQRSLRLMIPTVIAPRYGDAVRDGGRAPHQVPTQSIDAEYPFELELHVHGELARAVVASPTHPISVRMTGEAPDSELIVTLGRSAALDRDFVLVLNQLPHDSVGVLAQDFGAKDRYAVLASFCPRLPGADAAQPPAIAVKLLVDCSGSMGGDSIAAARRALTQIVTSFKPGDRFSLSRFGSQVEHRSKALWTLTEATRLSAQRWVGDLDADMGGTEMAGALESTFAIHNRQTCC